MDRLEVRLREDRPEEHHGVLVYDGERPFPSAAATALRRVPGAVSHYAEAEQRFLETRLRRRRERRREPVAGRHGLSPLA